jgi:hypothetical protein
MIAQKGSPAVTVEFHLEGFDEPWLAAMWKVPRVGEYVRLPHKDDYRGIVHEVEWIVSDDAKDSPYVLVGLKRVLP